MNDPIWQTRIETEKPDFRIGYHSRLLLMGSCFAENIGNKLVENRFAVDVNPCGVVYNPVSVGQVLELLAGERLLAETDLLQNNGKWVSLYHHGSFSSADRETCLSGINRRLQQGTVFLKGADLLLITWGTAWVYRYRANRQIAANCHKFPAGDFERFRLSVAEIVDLYDYLISRLLQLNPRLRILFTVSPIRHWKDGAHGNQLSKAVLLLAADELVKRWKQACYFPSYEIVMDELRDYRFYAEDMLHLSKSAVDYIWQRFRDDFLGEEAKQIIKQVERINKGLAHRPFDSRSEEYVTFRKKLLSDLKELKAAYPLLDDVAEMPGK